MTSLPALARFILVTLPFTSSVTLPVGFALKLYEAATLPAMLLLLQGGGYRLGGAGRTLVLWIVFLALSLVPSAYGLGLVLDAEYSLLEWATGRYQPVVNTLLHYGYLLLDIILLAVVLVCLRQGWLTPRAFARAWLVGALLAVIYAVLLAAALLVGVPPVWLLRWDDVQLMQVAGRAIARCGPFLEGNYLGLYLVISFVIALWAARRYHDRLARWIPLALALGILISGSPMAIALFFAIALYALLAGEAPPLVRTLLLVSGLSLVIVLQRTALFQVLVLDKLSLFLVGGVTDTANISLVERLNESYHAWQMFLDHPFGIGMGNYGYLFAEYPDLYIWLEPDFVNTKPIPNNVYLEILCEHGIVVFLLFLSILGGMGRALLRARQRLLAIGLLSVSVYFLVFPTFRLGLIWVFWAFCAALGAWRGDGPERGQAPAS